MEEIKKPNDYRLLLVGRTGAGKSSTGNTILGRTAFASSAGLGSVTAKVTSAEGEVDGRREVVVDTPGFFDTGSGNKLLSTQLVRMYAALAPGFHALIYVMSPERFTRECIKTKNLFFKVFGPSVARFTIIVLTGKDKTDAENISLQGLVSSGNAEFQAFLQQCGGRIFALNNKASENERAFQVSELFKIITEIQKMSGGHYFTNLQFQTMKLYRRLGLLRGDQNVKKARQCLFRRISDRYGVEEQSVWGPQSAENRKLTVTMKLLENREFNDLHVTEADDSENLDDTVATAGGKPSDDKLEELRNPTYFEKLVAFFSRLFGTFFKSIDVTD